MPPRARAAIAETELKLQRNAALVRRGEEVEQRLALPALAASDELRLRDDNGRADERATSDDALAGDARFRDELQ
jgi:hypothetical protein